MKQNPKGIGYVGLGYLESNIKALKVKKDADHRSHTHRGISSGWQLSRLPPAVHVLKQGVSQTVQDYLTWIKGSEGQKVVEQLEFAAEEIAAPRDPLFVMVYEAPGPHGARGASTYYLSDGED